MCSRKIVAVLTLFIYLVTYHLIMVNPPVSSEPLVMNPIVTDMIAQINESEIYNIVYQLQNFSTRVYGYAGNVEAGTYLYEKLSNISKLNVEYHGVNLRNVIATLPGLDETSDTIYMVGAHYDSWSYDPNDAPGATDNGGGVAIVLELARIMSQHRFRHTLQFALWNHEEGGVYGSRSYVQDAIASSLNISLYFNYDSSCYDPDNRFILDLMYNADSSWVTDMMIAHNDLYNIDFTLTYNVHGCTSDHRPFWEVGYPAVMTHQETHGPAHTPDDVIDQVSTLYAKKNGQLGLSVLAELAEVQTTYVHEISVENVEPSKTVIPEFDQITINVSVQNEGDFDEVFNLTLHVGTTDIEMSSLSVQIGSTTTIILDWNSSDTAKGYYNLTVTAIPVVNETDTSDNVLAVSIVITIRGDIDGDSDVDIYDVVKITGIYGSKRGDPQFNPNSDLDDDGEIKIYDVVMCTSHYGQTW